MAYELPTCECVMGQSPNLAELLKNIYCATYAGGGGGGLPDQAGHAGEFLTTDGTDASWVPLAGGGDVVASGALANNAIALGGGGTTVKTTTTGTGVVTALGVNVGSAGAFVVNGGALGTPSSGTLSNCTGLPLGSITGFGANVATFLATPSSANLAAAVTDETGSGLLVFGTAPVFASNITVGTAGGTTGAVLLRGTTSGTVTLTTAAAAGTWTLQLPAVDGDNGQVLTTNGSGVTSWETPASGSSLTATQVGFGSGANALTGEAAFTYDATTNTLTVDQVALGGGGVMLTPGAGTLTIQGDGGGQDENLTFDFNSDADTVTISSTTGVTLIDFDSIGIQTPAATITTVSVTTTFQPSTDNTVGLGDATHGWADLFLGSGALINISNGNWVATHSSGILTVSTGDLRVTNNFTNAASAVTVGGAQTLTNKTLTSPTVTTPTLSGAQQLAEGASLRLDQTLSADGTFSGITIAGTAGATLAFGDLIYLAVADSRWELVDADSVTTAGAVLTGMCVLAAAADGDPTVILLQGNIRADAAFPALTVGAPVYAGTTPGDIQVAQPSGTDDVIQVVGFALTADSIYFNPSQDYITHT